MYIKSVFVWGDPRGDLRLVEGAETPVVLSRKQLNCEALLGKACRCNFISQMFKTIYNSFSCS